MAFHKFTSWKEILDFQVINTLTESSKSIYKAKETDHSYSGKRQDSILTYNSVMNYEVEPLWASPSSGSCPASYELVAGSDYFPGKVRLTHCLMQRKQNTIFFLCIFVIISCGISWHRQFSSVDFHFGCVLSVIAKTFSIYGWNTLMS